MQPDTDPNRKIIKECCKDNLEFYFQGDGVEWEMWECKVCKLKYVVPIEIQRYWKDATLVINKKEK